MTKVSLEATMERSFQSTTKSLILSQTDCLSLTFHFVQGMFFFSLTCNIALFDLNSVRFLQCMLVFYLYLFDRQHNCVANY